MTLNPRVSFPFLAIQFAVSVVTLLVPVPAFSADVVTMTAPTIVKTFNPMSVPARATSLLTITLSNPANTPSILTAVFTDTLPSGAVIAPIPSLSTSCGGAATASPGGSTVSLASGSSIPSGSCTITVYVTAAAAGSYVNTIPSGALQTNHSDNQQPATSTLTVTAPLCPVITSTPTTMTNGFLGQPYSQTVSASGGTAPYTFTITSGTLPAGIVLSTVGGMGLLAGTPTTSGAHSFTILVTDASNCPASLAYVMTTTTAVPTMPQFGLLLLATVLATVGYAHLRD